MAASVEVEHTMFEVLFQRVLVPDAAGRDRLRLLGYDISRSRARYPGTVWRACLEEAALQVTPERPREEALRYLGRAMPMAYLGTMVGRVVRPMLELAGPRRAMHRASAVFNTVFSNVEATVEDLSPRSWRMRCFRYPAPAEVMAGTLDGGMDLLGVTGGSVVIERVSGDEQVFLLTI